MANFQSHLKEARIKSLDDFERTPITPINALSSSGTLHPTVRLFIKRDGVLGHHLTNMYGGSKLRKLKYIIPQALSTSPRSISTTGSEGSHHVLSTLSLSQSLNLPCHVALTPQRHSAHSLSVYQQIKDRAASITHLQALDRESYRDEIQRWREKPLGYVLPTGGSSPLGVYGMVEGAIELIEQIDEGRIPTPRCIYIATASGSSLAGLLLGLSMYWPKPYGILPEIKAIRVAPSHLINRKKIKRLYRVVSQTLNHQAPPPPV